MPSQGAVGQRRVLIVDDEPEIVEVLRQRLTWMRFAVSSAADGLEALEKIRAERPDLVLLDLRMPRMGGMDALREIRQVAPDLYVIVMTASTTHSVARACLAAGANDFLAKPFRPQDLVTRMRKVFPDIP